MDVQNIQYYSLEHLRQKLDDLPFRSPAVLLSEGGANRWGLLPFLLEKEKKGNLLWIKAVDPNPTQITVYNSYRTLFTRKGFIADGIVAIGGGSTIDLAKAFSAIYNIPDLDSPEMIIQAIRNKVYLSNEKNVLPIIAVPSTAGTGSEVTQWATIWDAASNMKYSVDAPWLKPKEAWIVSELTDSLPPRLRLATGLDAACHAAEAYWAKAGNPLSKAIAIRALEMITDNLRASLFEPRNIKARKSMSTGSLLAGLAFSMTRTTACHSISYPLTSRFCVEHGFAAAMTLAQVAEINSSSVDISELMAIFEPYRGMQEWLDGVCSGIVILRLTAFKISEQDLNKIADNAFTSGRMDNNPAELSLEMVKEILYKVL